MSTSAAGRQGYRPGEDRAGARYWSIDDIRLECGISLSSAWRLARRDGFPAPVVLAPKLIRWRRTEVLRFVDDLREPDRYAARGGAAAPAQPSGFITRAVRGR